MLLRRARASASMRTRVPSFEVKRTEHPSRSTCPRHRLRDDRRGPRRGGFVGHPELDHGAAERLEVRGGVVRDDPAPVDHRDALCQPIRLLEVLGREQHGGVRRDQLADQVPQLVAAVRVESRGRFVEEQHRRTCDERGRDIEAAAHPTRVGPDRPRCGLEQLEALEEFLHPRAKLPTGQLAETAHEPQVLAARQVRVDGRELAGQPDQATHRRRLARHVDTQHHGPPPIGPQDRRQDPDHRRLARTIRPQQAEHAADGNLEIDVIDRDKRAEPLRQTFDDDGTLTHPAATSEQPRRRTSPTLRSTRHRSARVQRHPPDTRRTFTRVRYPRTRCPRTSRLRRPGSPGTCPGFRECALVRRVSSAAVEQGR